MFHSSLLYTLFVYLRQFGFRSSLSQLLCVLCHARREKNPEAVSNHLESFAFKEGSCDRGQDATESKPLKNTLRVYIGDKQID